MRQYATFARPVSTAVGTTGTIPGADATATSGGAAPRRTRLTRRGRMVVVLGAAGLLLAAFSLGRVESQAAVPGDGPARPALEQTVVMPGDTLWSIAREVAPHNDPREVVAQIRELNDLSGGLVAGQQLLLPVAAA